MSKYTEYREIADRMKTYFGANIGNTDKKVYIRFNPVPNKLDIETPVLRNDLSDTVELTIEGEVGEALFKALKQIYE
jgi:hypothetical protein